MKTLTLTALLFCIVTYGYSQKITGEPFVAKFDDGSTLDYVVTSTSPNDENKVVWTLPFIFSSYDGPTRGLNFTSISYLQPGKFYVRANLTMAIVPDTGTIYNSNSNNTQADFGFELEGDYFLSSKEQKYSLKYELKSQFVGNNTIKVYSGKTDITQAYYTGIDGMFAYNPVVGPVIGAGAALFKARHFSYFSASLSQKQFFRTATSRLVADLLFYPAIPQWMLDQYTGAKPSPIGARVFYESRSSFPGHHDFGFYYQIGLGYGMGTVSFLMGFGLYTSF